MRRIFDGGLSNGDDTVVGLAGTGAEALENVKAAIRDVHGALPDMSFAIEGSVEAGDAIWVRVRGCGTATGQTGVLGRLA